MPNILKDQIIIMLKIKMWFQNDQTTERKRKLSFYQIKYILDDRSCYGHVGNRDTITRKIETDSFCEKS